MAIGLDGPSLVDATSAETPEGLTQRMGLSDLPIPESSSW